MAFNVSIIFNAIDRFSGTSRKMSKSLGDVEKKTEKTKKSANKASKAFLKLALAIASISGVSRALQVYTKFDDRLKELSAITGATGKDLKFLERSAFELGKEMAQSGADTLEAFKLVASAKPELLANLPALKAVTKEVLLLSKASGVDLATASAFTAQSLNIFGQGAEQAARFVNVLAAGSKFGSSEVAETGAALLIAGPAANAAGLSFEQLNAAIQTTALGGIKAERAGTALNSIFIKLQKAGFDLRKQSLEEVFTKIGGALDSQKNAATRTQMAIQLFGEEHIKVAEALIANKSALSAFESQLTGTNVATEQANIRLNTLSSRWKKIGVMIEQKVIVVLNQLAPMFDGILSSFEKMLSGISPDAISGIVGTFKLIGFVLKPVIYSIEMAVKALTLLFSTFGKVGKLIGLTGAEIFTGGSIEFLKEAKNIIKGENSISGKIGIDVNDPSGSVNSVSAESGTPGVSLNVGQNMGMAF